MHKKKLSAFLPFLLLSLLLILSLSGCGGDDSIGNNVSQPFSIAPVFQDFYQEIDGDEIFGGIISPPISEGNFIYQYTVNFLLIKDLQKEGEKGIRFYPVGREFALPETNSRRAEREGAIYKDGIAIYGEFLPYYEKLGRGFRLGKPLTGLRYNPQAERFEQLFEGGGMYMSAADLSGGVKFLAYGAWKCGAACVFPVRREAEVILSKQIDPHFLPFVRDVGLDFTGFALTASYISGENKIQQVFENVVIEADVNKPEQITLVEVPKFLGIFQDTPVAKSVGSDGIFIPVAGDKGFNVLPGFAQYIQEYGGLDLFGAPIGEAKSLGNGILQQCFQYVCLEEDSRLEGVYRIRLSPLGLQYLYLKNPQVEDAVQAPPPTPALEEGNSSSNKPGKEVSMEVWAARPWVGKNETQQVNAVVQINGQPQQGIIPQIILFKPDGEKINLDMPATDESGKSTIQLPAIDALNGTLIYYQVCIQLNSGTEYCAEGKYSIWAQP